MTRGKSGPRARTKTRQPDDEIGEAELAKLIAADDAARAAESQPESPLSDRARRLRHEMGDVVPNADDDDDEPA